MNEFRTIVRVSPANEKIGLKNRILTTGSCFADAIGERLIKYKFDTLANPFGATYNPLSIHDALKNAIERKPLPPDSFVENNNVYLNFNYHSRWWRTSKSELQQTLQNLNDSVGEFLRTCSFIMLTYGTAWIYSRKDNGEPVANCHKIPANQFLKTLVTAEDIVSSFGAFFKAIRMYNTDCKIILTVSPVRHLKDTLELNSVSKAMLRTACYEISQTFPETDYFPAYEIIMDDLRDYRFYKSDMIHPTVDAEEYIWQRFGERYFDETTKSFQQKWDNIIAALQHKPFQPQSENHQRFLQETLSKLRQFENMIDVSSEIQAIQSQMI